jgi:predicted AAA+ superfamily ATPase
MDRYVSDIIWKDLGRNVLFISGPRHVGKTSLAKKFLAEDQAGYLSWDVQ